ncbi:helix-turn-helix transcriptional regulator [Isoptericola jiangsuensis]|uniref:helix-turn-helix transcriptional regulator n=1 Tax=Isoptericola jiangsuensis TaxID=548579 RepID=UPI003AAD780E
MEPTTIQRGHDDLERGLRLHAHGPTSDALASLGLAGHALAGRPQESLAVALASLEVAWSAGDLTACLTSLSAALDAGPTGLVRDHLEGMHALLTERPLDAAGPLRAAAEEGAVRESAADLLTACDSALLLGEVRQAGRIAARALAVARSADDGPARARASERLAYAELRAGRHAMAREHATTGLRAAWQAGQVNAAAHHHAVLALVASVQGPWDVAVRHAAAADIARRHGLCQPVTLAEWARARTEVGQGRFADARTRLTSLLRGDGNAHFALRGLVIPTCVEAGWLAGDLDGATTLVDELAAWSSAADDPHGPALVLRCRALVTDGDDGDDLFRAADAAHVGPDADLERARTALLHGMWLRRARRPVDSRERLRAAVVLFERCGAPAWATVARTELRSAGAATTDDEGAPGAALGRLTPHQRRIARYVAAGDTNRDVADRLGVSVRTVDCHLRNIFAALQVRSRTELARLVPAPD